jgi:hypothetical protein
VNRWLPLGARPRKCNAPQIEPPERLVLLTRPRQGQFGTAQTTATTGSQQKQFWIE